MFDVEKHVTSEKQSTIGSKYVSVDYGTQNATVYLFMGEEPERSVGCYERILLFW